MKGIRIKLMFLVGMLAFNTSYAQMVKGYFPYYRSVAQANAVQYNHLTDVIYAFADLAADGSLTIRGPGGIGDMSVFNAIKANCTANGVRLWVAIGGWDLSGNFSGVAGNATRRTALANACLNLCNTHGLAGIDIDWEFPAAGDAANYTLMLQAIKGALGTTYKLSAALGGESFIYSCVNQGHSVGVQAAAFTHLDYFNIMSYDAPACFPNHTSLDFMQRSMDGWYARGCPYEKMIPGVAFYGRPNPDSHLWYMVASSTHFNDEDGIVGGIGFDTKPTIEAKTNYAMCTRGAPGMMVWELTQDVAPSSPYALLPVLAAAVNACGCPFGDPDLGADRSLCGTGGSITLSSGIAASGGRTFTWTRNGSPYAGTDPNNTVTTAGTYAVTVSEGVNCVKVDEVVISASLPTPALGADRVICDPAFHTLAPSNLASFPGGTTWQWRRNSTIITGATSSSLANVREAGTYRLTASISGCSSTNDDIVLTSSVPVPVDGCAASAPIPLAITGATAGPYTWYNVATGGSSLGTGTTFSASSAGTYYVQAGAASPPYYVGLAGPANSFQNPTGTGVGLTFTTTATVTINSVDVFLPSGANGNIQISIRNSANSADVYTGPLTAVNNSTGSVQRVTVPVGANLSAGNYRMVATGTVSLLVNTAPSYPITNNNVSITGSFGLGSYVFFFNWEIAGSGSACKRLPVVATVNGSCVAAPVELIRFAAKATNGQALLEWTTAQEINNDHFKIERSTDGDSFTEVERVEGQGNTSAIVEYEFLDPVFLSQKTYYRLAQYDLDGTVSYSKVISLEVSSASFVSISPNPFTAYTDLLVQSAQESVEVKLTDLQGRDLGRQSLKTGEHHPIGEQLAPGIYILEIFTEEKIHRQKIIKE